MECPKCRHTKFSILAIENRVGLRCCGCFTELHSILDDDGNIVLEEAKWKKKKNPEVKEKAV